MTDFPSNFVRIPVSSDLAASAVSAARRIAQAVPIELHCHPSWADVGRIVLPEDCELVLHDDLCDVNAWYLAFADGQVVGSEGC